MEDTPFIMRHPHYIRAGRSNRIFWMATYAIAVIVILSVGYILASAIRTRSLPNGKVTLSVPYSQYLVGENITFTLTNNYNSSIYVTNKCPTEPLDVYRYENNQWVRLHDTASEKDCSDENRQISIAANSSMTGTFAPWHNLFNKPGKYRVVAYVEYYNSLPYQDFEIIEKPIAPAVVAINPSTPTSSNTPTSTPYTSPTSSTPSSTPSQPTTPSQQTPPPATSQSKTIPVIYNSATIGTVTVTYTNSYITVNSIKPAAGYTYEGGHSGATIEIVFKKAELEVQLHLWLSNGVLMQSVIKG